VDSGGNTKPTPSAQGPRRPHLGRRGLGFHRLGGIGECTSRYQPEPLPQPGAAGVGMASRSRPQ